jgi:NADH-quinone oxidoreductase subunit J
MNAPTVIFYILAACILAFGLLAVTVRKIFRAAVFLLFSLIGVAGLYFLLDYEFIGAVQIIVYVGGIVVLLIFSIFLTHGSGGHMKKPRPRRVVFGALAGTLGASLTMSFINNQQFSANDKPAIAATAGEIGGQMLSVTEHGYILPFEVVSFLLLAAMIGCIVIAVKIKLPAQQMLTADTDDVTTR